MNKTNIKILVASFVIGFLFLGLTDSIKSINNISTNIPNQSASVILAQNDVDTSIDSELILPGDYGYTYDYIDTTSGYGDNVNTNVPNPDNINFEVTPDYEGFTVTSPVSTTNRTTTDSDVGIVAEECRGGDPTQCDISALGKTARNLIKMAIEIGLILAALAFAYAGWLFMSAGGDSSKISQAKGIFWKVLIGVIIAMSAFSIIQIILSSLGVTDGIGDWINTFIG